MNKIMNHLVPVVVESTARGERSFDIFSRLLKDRIILLGTPIDGTVANLIIAQMLFLQSEDPEKEIGLYINSPGGEVSAGMAIYDTMQYIKPPVQTLCLGMAMSMAALLLCAGAEGSRMSLPHASILIHQPHVGKMEGQASDIAIHAKEMLRVRGDLDGIIALHSGQSIEKVAIATDRDNFFTAQGAKEFGLIDDVIEPQRLKELMKKRAKENAFAGLGV